MKKIQFIFGIHLHQPVGNFDWVFEEAYQKSYKPFIDTIRHYPSVSLVIHISGPLLEWLEDNHPEYLEEISMLIQTRDIEILSAGFYEPILAVIPDHDKVGQIKKLNMYIKKQFSYTAKGIWLTERVWEPHLVKQIKNSNIDYLAVDDYHFFAAGKNVDELDGYFTTDEQDSRISIFPISQRLRYSIPFQEPSVTIEYLRSLANDKGDKVVVMADDAEKFGVWPSTYETCYGKNKWLSRFFEALERNQDWLETTTFKTYHSSNKPRGRIYLPTVSYFEMSEWTLPANGGKNFSDLVNKFESEGKLDDYRQFLRGGMWRNFQNIYDESNWMQKRVTDLSFIFEKIKDKFSDNDQKNIQDHIWKAQCNCAYWHGVFGGLYLPHLRHGIYENLIAADKIITKVLDPFKGTFDIDNDGFEEVDLVSDYIKIIASAKGGVIREFDILSKNFNILNTMHQVSESYHHDIKSASTGGVTEGSIHNNLIAKEANLDKVLNVDKYPRYMLIDHFYPYGVTLDDAHSNVKEKGDFAEREFEVIQADQIKFSAIGKAYDKNTSIEKEISLSNNELIISIVIKNLDEIPISGIYGSELNFSLLGGHSDDRYYVINGSKPIDYHLDSKNSEENIQQIDIVNEYDKFVVSTKFNESTNVWRFPVLTVSGSESGLEKVYQSSTLIPHWEIVLSPNEELKVEFKIIIMDD